MHLDSGDLKEVKSKGLFDYNIFVSCVGDKITPFSLVPEAMCDGKYLLYFSIHRVATYFSLNGLDFRGRTTVTRKNNSKVSVRKHSV